jgi:hypothetical protein
MCYSSIQNRRCNMVNEKPTSVVRRHRSPAYPYLNLPTAIEKAQLFFEKERSHKASVEAALEHIGYGAGSSSGFRALASLLQFGLLEEEGSKDNRVVWLSDLGRQILLDKREESSERIAAIKQAVLRPQIHDELWTRWKDHGGLPSDATIETTLVKDMGFNPKAAPEFIKELRDSLNFAQVWEQSSYAREMKPSSGSGVVVEAPAYSSRDAARPTTSSATDLRNITIPLVGGGMAVLSIPHPLSRKNYDLVEKWLHLMREALTEETNDQGEAVTSE